MTESKKDRYVSMLIIASDEDPKSWTLENFKWAIENSEARMLSTQTGTTESFVKLGSDLKTLVDVVGKL